jgi:putative membrane protein
MISRKLRINNRNFIKYKFFNSLFLGTSVGSIFTIYAPLEPSVYSLGGIFLALGMLFVATLYSKILNINYFYKISLFVELVILSVIIAFLLLSFNYQIALFVYIGYQLTFMFGSYLVRGETLIIKKDRLLSLIDIAKQFGYLFGLGASFLFYKFIEYQFQIIDNQTQVFYIHYFLLLIEIIVIILLVKSFEKFKHY